MRLQQTIPALPVKNVPAAATFYRDRLGFHILHQSDGFAIARRDAAELHLWEAGDDEWQERGSWERPVRSGAESFIAGTASCRIRVDGVDDLYQELRGSGVLHAVSQDGIDETDFGTRDFHTLDLDGNLLTFFAPTPVTDADRGKDAIAAWSAMSVEAMAALDPDGDFGKQHLLNPAGGAQVVALEPADGLYRYAVAKEAQLRQGIKLVQADLTDVQLQPEFDAVVVNMVFVSIPDWQAALGACVAALRPGGQLVFSLEHPCFEQSSGDWGRTGRVEVTEYLADYEMPRPAAPDFHRPLATYVNAVIAAGCRIVEIAEPGLDPELAAGRGPGGAALVHVPNFLVVSAVRDGHR